VLLSWKMTVPGSSTRMVNLTQPGSPVALATAKGSSGKTIEFLAYGEPCARRGQKTSISSQSTRVPPKGTPRECPPPPLVNGRSFPVLAMAASFA
jgi:hypothetical protein